MGIKPNIDYDHFPKQSDWLHKRVKVCFRYDVDKTIMGFIVRDDMEEPGETIIVLDNGRFVRGAECMYTPPI